MNSKYFERTRQQVSWIIVLDYMAKALPKKLKSLSVKKSFYMQEPQEKNPKKQNKSSTDSQSCTK